MQDRVPPAKLSENAVWRLPEPEAVAPGNQDQVVVVGVDA